MNERINWAERDAKAEEILAERERAESRPLPQWAQDNANEWRRWV